MTSHYRNLFVAASSAAVFVVHAEPSSKTEKLCQQILSLQKPNYRFDSHYNNNLIKMGTRPVTMDNVSLWVNILAVNVDK